MITNFGGNVRFTPENVYTPSSETEVLDILNRHANGKIRVVGALHSWSPVVECAHSIIDLRRFDQVALATDADGVRATVGGGCRIKDLLRKLHALGDVTVPSLGLITEQTIAGAISTATHGSGRHSLSHYIDEIRVAAFDADGNACIHVFRGGVELQAARCALGCMGVILAVSFRCVPKYEVAETIIACATLEEVLAGQEQYPLQQFYLVPHDWTYFVQRRAIAPGFRARRRLSSLLYGAWWFLGVDVGLHLIIFALTRVLRSRRLTRFFYRHILAKMIVKNCTIVDHSERILVMEHELFRHVEIEIFVPERHVRAAVALTRAVLAAFDGAADDVPPELDALGLADELRQRRGAFTHHYAITFRRVLPDDTLISMTAGADEAWQAISFITYAVPREDFEALASILARSMARLFGARLHWGKYFPPDADDVASTYPRLAEFRAQCDRVDPRGVFRNPFVERVLFGVDAATSDSRQKNSG